MTNGGTRYYEEEHILQIRCIYKYELKISHGFQGLNINGLNMTLELKMILSRFCKQLKVVILSYVMML